jgi:arylsulfatase
VLTETTFHGIRYGNFKLLYKDQEEWFRSTQDELTTPYIINLKADPFERFIKARGYDEYAENRSWIFGPAMIQLNEFVQSFKDYPPRQPSFSPKVDDLINVIKKSPAD